VNARGGFCSLVSGGGVVVVHRRSGHRTLHCACYYYEWRMLESVASRRERVLSLHVSIVG
jgi:hypothetical protein